MWREAERTLDALEYIERNNARYALPRTQEQEEESENYAYKPLVPKKWRWALGMCAALLLQGCASDPIGPKWCSSVDTSFAGDGVTALWIVEVRVVCNGPVRIEGVN